MSHAAAADTFSVMLRAAAVVFLSAAVLAAAAPPAAPSDRLQVGIADSAEVLEQPSRAFPLLSQLGVRVIRVTLYWGSVRGVARRRPTDGVNPADPAYNWAPFDRAVLAADQRGIKVVFSIWGTPGWANGGNPANRAPRNPVWLQAFAYAAATRYSGTYTRSDGVTLPRVHQWVAWNEPNLRLGLVPQWRQVGGKWVPQSAYDYADICNAIYAGVHMTLIRDEQVACGATAARGNNNPRARWASVAPLGFMQAMRRAGVTHIDAYAHHAYSDGPRDAPGTVPRNPTALTLGQPAEPGRRGHEAMGAEADLDHRVRLRDLAAGHDVRRPVVPPGGLRDVRGGDRAPEPARGHADLVPAPR